MQVIGNQVFVTYAVQDVNRHDPVAAPTDVGDTGNPAITHGEVVRSRRQEGSSEHHVQGDRQLRHPPAGGAFDALGDGLSSSPHPWPPTPRSPARCARGCTSNRPLWTPMSWIPVIG